MIFRDFSSLILIACSLSMVECKDRLHIGMLQPLSDGFSTDGHTFVQFAKMAIRDINARNDILADYELESSYLDTRVS